MLRLLIDENFNQRVVRGLKRRLPRLDFVLVKDVGLKGAADVELLQWAAQWNRVILTHDVKTMTHDAEQLVKLGRPMAGVILVPDTMAIGTAIKNLELFLDGVSDGAVRDQVKYLPLRAEELQKQR